MRERIPWVITMLAAATLHAGTRSGLRQPTAGEKASFDNKSFRIGAERLLLLCAGVHYFRLEPSEWRDRLLQTRLAGFNAVETPVPWSLHEPKEGTFRFDGIADLGRFLDLCHELKLRAFLRIGPFVNAALSNGGLPAWLGEDPRIKVRSADKRFLTAVRAYWDKLAPIVRERLVPVGPVLLVQVEDNYRGREGAYLSRLFQDMDERNIQVPVVVSELNPCRSFGPLLARGDAFRATAAYLPAAPVLWGQPPRATRYLDAPLFDGLAGGLVGYNHLMWAAGTNHAVLQASSFPTRFEAGASGLLEGGGHSGASVAVRKVNLFARAFEKVLADAAPVRSHPLLDQARRIGMVGLGRTARETSLLFIKRDHGSGPLTLKDEATGVEAQLPVNATTFRHVVVGYPLSPRTRLALSTAQVLTIQKFRDRHVFVVYAPAEERVAMVFRTPSEPRVRAGGDGLSWDGDRSQLVLRWRPRTRGARRADFAFEADVAVQVIAIEERLVAETWVLDAAAVVVKCPGIADWRDAAPATIRLRLPPKRSRFTASVYPAGPQRGLKKVPGIAAVRHDDAARRSDFDVDFEAPRPVPHLLDKWETAPAAAEAAPNYDDADWAYAASPKPFGQGAYGWYRCKFSSTRAIRSTLRFDNVADAVMVLLNGKFVGQSPTKRLMDGPRTFRHTVRFDVELQRGDNVVAVLAKSWGRYRNTSSFGVALGEATGWGILGPVWIKERPLRRWRQREGTRPDAHPLAWEAVPEVPGPAPCWYRTRFARRPHPGKLVPRAILRGLGYGAMWLNGRYAGLYQQRAYDGSRGCLLPPAWLRDENEIIVLEEGGKKPQRAEVRYDRKASFVPLTLELQ